MNTSVNESYEMERGRIVCANKYFRVLLGKASGEMEDVDAR